jgi:lipopolysaccharide export LptBFGC system permease protein LptF
MNRKLFVKQVAFFNYTGSIFMQVILFILFFLIAIPLALKFPKIVKAIFKGIFSFIIYFVKNAPDAINKANNQKRKD